jgi:1,4-dihydroxy-2-naphthoate octaprenyltransferase
VIRRLAAVVVMTRPPQLLLVTIVALLGVAVARADGADPTPACVATGLLVLLAGAASIHLANEYADHETDARTVRTPFSGGSGALPRTGLPRTLALDAARATGGVALTGGMLGVLLGAIPVAAVVVLVVGIVGGWAYSIGPYPLAWRGLGEATNAILGGMLLPLYGVALAGGTLDARVVLAFLPLTLVVGINLLATTWPDRDADASVGKRTLATRWSTARLRRTYALAATGAIALLALQAHLGDVAPLVGIAGLTATPLLALGLLAYTVRRSPLPTVAAMVWLIVAQLGAWVLLG